MSVCAIESVVLMWLQFLMKELSVENMKIEVMSLNVSTNI